MRSISSNYVQVNGSFLHVLQIRPTHTFKINKQNRLNRDVEDTELCAIKHKGAHSSKS